MKTSEIIILGVKNPKEFFRTIISKVPPFIFPDEPYLKLLYRLKLGEKLNLNNPQTFNEKLNWLKLFDRRPEYTQMVDKIEVKQLVSSIVGGYIIPTLGVWEDPNEIDLGALPNQFVLKCNHNSGGLFICKDKQKLTAEKWGHVKKELKRSLEYNYYWYSREWPYKNVKRRILAEKYMEDSSGGLKDYKFFCFNGKVKAMFIATDRQTVGEEVKFDFFDENFNHLPFKQGHDNAKITPSKPSCFEEMKQVAEKLSAGIPHVRVDLYEINGNVYFGELTFSHFDGTVPFKPKEWDYTFGSWLDLTSVKK